MQQAELVRQLQFENVTSYDQLPPAIVVGIIACVRSAFEGGVTDDDTRHHMQGDLITVYLDTNDTVVSFSSTMFGSPDSILNVKGISSEQGCYLSGATVAKESQGTGLYTAMNRERIAHALEKKLKVVFTRTQNPRVQAGIEAVLKEAVANGQITDYTLERSKVAGHYGAMLTKTKPEHSDISYDDLDYAAGDAYILVFTLKYPTVIEEK